MKRISVTVLLVLAGLTSVASDLQITNFSFTGSPRDADPKIFVYFTVSWKNAWRNDRNHDGVWIFVKMRHQNEARQHRAVPVKLTGHELVNNYISLSADPSFFVPVHKAGIMLFPAAGYRGDISWRVKIALDITLVRGIDFANNTIFGDVFGIEMVNIPGGSFYIGDSDTANQNRSSALYHFPDKQRLLINSEREIRIGKGKGELYYDNVNGPENRGDMRGPVRDSFPKGFKEFYVMKYELTQGQYASFLNTLSNQPSYFRANFTGKSYYDERGTIRIQDGKYIATKPDRPANYISWDDGCAFADWAGLRPPTELEYEKAARGSQHTVPKDYPWGNTSSEKMSRYYNQEGDLVYENKLQEKDLTDSNLELFGASYYWVMDLGGSLWERVATIGNPKGREFKGSHGDGMVDQFGNATNSDWPTEHDGGFGYRGGGYYGFGMAFGPSHTPVGSRPFGSWGDGPRSVAYGFRAALTAN